MPAKPARTEKRRRLAPAAPDPATIRTGWRYWALSPEGSYLPPFGRGDLTLSINDHHWRRATCDGQVPAWAAGHAETAQFLREIMLDPDPHDAPSARCTCGWRYYPRRRDVAAASAELPEHGVIHLDNANVVVTQVEVAGRTMDRATMRVSWGGEIHANTDEVYARRAEWLRIPRDARVLVAPSLPRRLRQRLIGRVEKVNAASVRLALLR